MSKILRIRDFRSPTFSSYPVNRVNPIILLTIRKISKIKNMSVGILLSCLILKILRILLNLENPSRINTIKHD